MIGDRVIPCGVLHEPDWFLKKNERTPGVPRSRVPEYSLLNRGIDLEDYLWCRLEEVLVAFDNAISSEKD